MIEIFDNFAFDEVLRDIALDVPTRLIVQSASMIAAGAVSEYRVMLGAALTVGVTPAQVEEIVYQAVAYVGMARVFDFVHATNEVMTERGIALPPAPQSTTTPHTRHDDGLAAQKRCVGDDTVTDMYASAPSGQAHIQRYLSANCFGDYYTRGGLDVGTRELITFAMIVSLGGCEPQAAGRVRANRNVGNDRVTLIDVVAALLPFIGYPRAIDALRVIDEVLPATTGG
ncbi:carboxymuconolactone decarboxylase family protein [Nocardia sp. NBC_01377]|uniref:carboxymuconolactone decarboxylase family protein n=1 Tax=Nocardia sp. NBC_01377 TaxID=2903595 RepID=UPI00325696E8